MASPESQTSFNPYGIISKYADVWFAYWSRLTASPHEFAINFDFKSGTAITIFIINNALGAFVFMLMHIVYWSVAYPRVFLSHVMRDDSVFMKAIYSPRDIILFLLITYVIPALATFLVFRSYNGKGKLVDHISMQLLCTNLEFLTGLLFGCYFIFVDIYRPYRDAILSYGEITVLFFISAFLFGIKLYYCHIQSILLSRLHFGYVRDGMHAVDYKLMPTSSVYMTTILLIAPYILIYKMFLRALIGRLD